MRYAVFEDEERLTRSFATRQEAWDAAERVGLVEIGPDGNQLLDGHLEIRTCIADPEDDETGFDFRIC